MSLNGEGLTELCDRKGTDDGAAGAPFSPPVNESETEAFDAYAYAYWVAVRYRVIPEMDPQPRLVRRARMVAMNKARKRPPP